MRVRVDSALCRGHGVCCSISPDMFEIVDDGYAHPIHDEVTPEHVHAVNEAVQACPEQAIATD